MSTTDPLREAVRAWLCFDNEVEPPATAAPYAEHLAYEQAKADITERVAETLAAVPVEPEVWEYGFSAQGDVVAGYGRCATASEAQAMLAVMSAGYQRRAHIVRRRPGTAPGPWERVDPEPLQEEPNV